MKLTSKVSKRLTGLLAVGVLAATPVLTASAVTDSTDINATVNSTISMNTSGTVSVQLTPGGSPVLSVANDTVSVSTNSTAGYTLSLANDDANTALVGTPTGTINAHTGTTGSPTPLTAGTWGFAVAGFSGFDASYTTGNNQATNTAAWAGVPASGSGVLIKDHTGTAANNQTAVSYGVYIDSSQEEGQYTDTVVYTATAK